MDFSGISNSLAGNMLPDVQTAFQFYATHWRKVNSDWQYPIHTHPAFELNVVLQGIQHMTVGGIPHIQQPGDVLIIQPGVEHVSTGSGNGKSMSYFSLHFDIDDPAFRHCLLAKETNSLTGNEPTVEAVRHALDQIIRWSIIPEPDTRRYRLLLLRSSFELLSALCDWAMEEPGTTLPDRDTDVSSWLAHDIERRLTEAVSMDYAIGERRSVIEDIAAELGYSTSHCNYVFHRIFGKSPRQYLSELIIRRAKLLLLDSRLSVEEVTRRVGYRDVSHFSKQFKRWTGLSPLGYRKLSQGHKE